MLISVQEDTDKKVVEATMRAIVEKEHGDPEVLTLSEVPIPAPAPGQVLVRVHAAGLNRADSLQRRGHYPPPAGASSVYGLEIAGVVEAVGEGVDPTLVGERVMALLAGGGYAEYAAVDVRHTLPVPKGMSMVEAACIPEVAATVYSNLVLLCGMSLDPAQNNPAEDEQASLLVHGGTGGVGMHAIQLARAAGVRVFATVGDDEKAQVVRALGAHPINYRTESFRQVIQRESAGHGVNYILDVVGAKYLEDNLRSLADGGHLATIAVQGGRRAELDLGLMLTKRLSVHGTSLRSRSADEKAKIMAGVHENVLPLLERGVLSANLDREFPWWQASQAHEYFDAGQHRGKVVLRVM